MIDDKLRYFFPLSISGFPPSSLSCPLVASPLVLPRLFDVGTRRMPRWSLCGSLRHGGWCLGPTSLYLHQVPRVGRLELGLLMVVVVVVVVVEGKNRPEGGVVLAEG